MKKIIATAVIGMGILSSGMAVASDGTITINGLVTTTSCDVSVDGGTGDATVTLPDVSSVQLAETGDVAGAKDFSFALTGCSTGGKVRAYFENDNVNLATGNLENEVVSNEGGATNVQVQITDGEGTRIDLASTTQTNNPYIDIADDAATLPYKAQYVSSNGQVIAGLVNTNLVYTLEYQ